MKLKAQRVFDAFPVIAKIIQDNLQQPESVKIEVVLVQPRRVPAEG